MRSKLTYANVMATLAVVIALAGSTSAVAAVIISNNNQVAQNTIAGHAPPAGKHANLISGSVNGTDLAAAYKTSVKVHCPSGMALLSGLCYETGTHSANTWETAMATCQIANRRLPTVGELAMIYNVMDADQLSEWTDSWSFVGSFSYAVAVSQNTSRKLAVEDAVTNASFVPYRCVASASN